MNGLESFDFLTDPEERKKQGVKPAGGALDPVMLKLSRSETVFHSQVIILVQGKGGHMLQAVVFFQFQGFERIGKSPEQEAHPGFEGKDIGCGNVKPATRLQDPADLTVEILMVQDVFGYLDGNCQIEGRIGIREETSNVGLQTLDLVKFEVLREQVTGRYIIAHGVELPGKSSLSGPYVKHPEP